MRIFPDTGFLADGAIRLRLNRTADTNPQKGWASACYFTIQNSSGEDPDTCDLRRPQ